MPIKGARWKISHTLTIVTLSKDDAMGLMRTYQSLEENLVTQKWIIVYPGESDSSHQFIVRLCKRHSTISTILDSGMGIYRAMNLAISHLDDEEWVWFLNGGDELASFSAISRVTEYINSITSRWFYGRFCLATVDSGLLGNPVVSPEFSVRNQLYARNFVNHQSTIMRVSLVKELRGFDEGLEVAADWDLMVRASLQESPSYLDEMLTIFYLGGLSTKLKNLGNKELLGLRRRYLNVGIFDFIYSYIWYLIRVARNFATLFIEKLSPKFLDRMRRLKLEK